LHVVIEVTSNRRRSTANNCAQTNQSINGGDGCASRSK